MSVPGASEAALLKARTSESDPGRRRMFLESRQETERRGANSQGPRETDRNTGPKDRRMGLTKFGRDRAGSGLSICQVVPATPTSSNPDLLCEANSGRMPKTRLASIIGAIFPPTPSRPSDRASLRLAPQTPPSGMSWL